MISDEHVCFSSYCTMAGKALDALSAIKVGKALEVGSLVEFSSPLVNRKRMQNPYRINKWNWSEETNKWADKLRLEWKLINDLSSIVSSDKMTRVSHLNMYFCLV